MTAVFGLPPPVFFQSCGARVMPDAMMQRLKLSIVIPAPADTQALEETLVSVLENRPDHCEVIVALGCEYADPWNIGDEVQFVRAEGSGCVACVNAGIAASTGSVVHLLAAGWKATPGWTDAALARLRDRSVGAVAAVATQAARPEQVTAVGIRLSSGGRRIVLGTDSRAWAEREGARRVPFSPVTAPALEAGFWRAEVVRPLGFSAPCGDLNADADKAVELAAAGLVTVLEKQAVVVAPEQVQKRPGAFMEGLQRERLFWRSLAGRSLVASLPLHAWEIVRHAVLAAPLGTLPMLLGRLVATLQFGSYLSRYRQLKALLQAATARAAEPVQEELPSIRIDAAHGCMASPHRQVVEAPLRRSA